MMGVWTTEMMDETIADFKGKAREVFAKDGFHHSMAFLFSHLDPKDLRMGPGIVAVAPEFKNHEFNKDEFAQRVRTVAALSLATGVIFISEAWYLEAASTDEAERVYKSGEPLEHNPRAIECLMFQVETQRRGHALSYAQILREGNAPPALAPWVERGFTRTEGRYAPMLLAVS